MAFNSSWSVEEKQVKLHRHLPFLFEIDERRCALDVSDAIGIPIHNSVYRRHLSANKKLLRKECLFSLKTRYFHVSLLDFSNIPLLYYLK